MFDHKITELKYHIDGLMPKAICDSLINFFETKNTYLRLNKVINLKKNKM